MYPQKNNESCFCFYAISEIQKASNNPSDLGQGNREERRTNVWGKREWKHWNIIELLVDNFLPGVVCTLATVVNGGLMEQPIHLIRSRLFILIEPKSQAQCLFYFYCNSNHPIPDWVCYCITSILLWNMNGVDEYF